MSRWTIQPIWQGEDAYIIGGGASLQSFDWNRVKGKRTIGCNSAYQLGAEICNVCIFTDRSFWTAHKKELEKYRGMVFTAAPFLLKSDLPWLHTLPRKQKGLHEDALGWNGNTGSSAINLALLFGARRVILLGFDMKMTSKKANWYKSTNTRNCDNTYKDFLNSFCSVVKAWKEKFGDREIINVNNDSKLTGFPIVPVTQFFQEVRS